MKEFKIGEDFSYLGMRLTTVPGKCTPICALRNLPCKDINCRHYDRSDNTAVYFIEIKSNKTETMDNPEKILKTISMFLEDARKLYATSTPEWKKILEDNFGKENLVQLTYQKIAEKLFLSKQAYFVDKDGEVNNSYISYEIYAIQNNNCITKKQAEHLIAHNQLINVATYLNNKTKISDNCVYYLKCNKSTSVIITESTGIVFSHGIVAFNTRILAEQAIDILGKETIIKALTYE